MDMLKAQMMTLTMVSGMQGIHGQRHQGAGGGGGGSGITNMIYIFLVTALIDFACKTMGPRVLLWIKEYYDARVKNTIDKMASKISDASGGMVSCAKTASIEITIQDVDPQNILGLSILDYITNHENTHHISYKNRNFVLNQTDVIEMNEDFKIIMKKERHLMGGGKDAASMSSSSGSSNGPSSGGGGGGGSATGATVEQLFEVFSYTKSIQEMRKFLNEIRDAYVLKIQNKLGDNIFYFNMVTQNANRNGIKDYSVLAPHAIFSMKRFHTNRKFTNLFGPEIAAVSKRVRFFMNNRKWYDAKGIPYTLGLLLSGQAGAGKTSSIKCLANETQRHIININLNNDISKTQMENLFFNETMQVVNAAGHTETLTIAQNKRIYVLEDVDCQDEIVWERTLKKPEERAAAAAAAAQTAAKGSADSYNIMAPNLADKIDLSFLLNLLDGILETPGRIVIMTSNQPKMLDHALIRPGRIDVIADFKKCDHETTIEMIEFFYDVSLTEEEKVRVRALAPYSLSPAELGKMMFENFGDYVATIREMEADPRFSRISEGGLDSNFSNHSNPIVGIVGIVGDEETKDEEEKEEEEEKNSAMDMEIRRDATNKNTIVIYDDSSSLQYSPYVADKNATRWKAAGIAADDLAVRLGRNIDEEKKENAKIMGIKEAKNLSAADEIFEERKNAMMKRMKQNDASANTINDSVKPFDAVANTTGELSAFNDSTNWFTSNFSNI
jgi:hypothetical protein